jgi:hypothetical protein
MRPGVFLELGQWSISRLCVNLDRVQVVPSECRNSVNFLFVIFKKREQRFFDKRFEVGMVELVNGFVWRILLFLGTPVEMSECFLEPTTTPGHIQIGIDGSPKESFSEQMMAQAVWRF